MRKRIRTLFGVLLVLALVMTACNKSETPETTETTEATTEATEAATSEITEAAATEAASEAPVVEIEKGVVDMDALLAEGKPIMLQISQDGCPPCEQMLPYVKSLQDEYADSVIVRYVDAMENTPLMIDYQIQFTPTQIFLDAEGNIVSPEAVPNMEDVTSEDGTSMPRHIGLLTEDELRAAFAELTE